MMLSYGIDILSLVLDLNYNKSQSSPIELAVSMFLALAVTVWMAWKISAGRNWARIVLLILVVISVPRMFADTIVTAPRAPHIAGLELVEIGLDVAVLYLLFFPGFEYFRRRTQPDKASGRL